MAEAADPGPASRDAAIADAKLLIRLARTGALATLEAKGGAPLTTLVGLASDFDGAPLFLMSSLSRHMRNIESDARACVLLTAPPQRGDPLNHPRLSLAGSMERTPDANAKQRYLQRNPKAKLYASFADFALYRLAVADVHFNGGFGRADLLQPADVLSSAAGSAELIGAEAQLLDAVNRCDAGALALLAGGAETRRQAWRAIGLDGEGVDLAAGSAVARVCFAARATDAPSWLAQFEAARLRALDGPARSQA